MSLTLWWGAQCDAPGCPAELRHSTDALAAGLARTLGWAVVRPADGGLGPTHTYCPWHLPVAAKAG